MDVISQIKNGKLRCPKTGQTLIIAPDKSYVSIEDGSFKYKMLHNKTPILLRDEEFINEHLDSSGDIEKIKKNMEKQSEVSAGSFFSKLKGKIRTVLKNSFWAKMKSNDYRSQGSIDCFERIVNENTEESLSLSIGGGPNRVEGFTNLNIAPFDNVDIVADAHYLPYGDESVDAIFSEAVLEHLYDPQRAVNEVFRTLKPGGSSLTIAPFLHVYHGYPHNYCNFTLTGHMNLFQNAGFDILDSGTCVGPAYTVYSLNMVMISNFFPKFIRLPFKILMRIFGILFIKPMDRRLNINPESHIMATSTYVYAKKPLIR